MLYKTLKDGNPVTTSNLTKSTPITEAQRDTHYQTITWLYHNIMLYQDGGKLWRRYITENFENNQEYIHPTFIQLFIVQPVNTLVLNSMNNSMKDRNWFKKNPANKLRAHCKKHLIHQYLQFVIDQNDTEDPPETQENRWVHKLITKNEEDDHIVADATKRKEIKKINNFMKLSMIKYAVYITETAEKDRDSRWFHGFPPRFLHSVMGYYDQKISISRQTNQQEDFQTKHSNNFMMNFAVVSIKASSWQKHL